MVKMTWYDTAQLSKLESAIQEQEWFTAIVLSATQIERHGYLVIKEYLDSVGVDSDLVKKMLERTHLYGMAGFLLAIGKVDQHEHDAILRINKVRNKFIHRREEEEFKRGTVAKKEYEPLMKEAIRILKEKLNAVRLFVSR